MSTKRRMWTSNNFLGPDMHREAELYVKEDRCGICKELYPEDEVDVDWWDTSKEPPVHYNFACIYCKEKAGNDLEEEE